MPQYDSLAWCYDILARLVFGQKLRSASTRQLHHLLSCEHILWIGGGTGYEIAFFEKAGYKGRICFIDESAKMVNRARKKVKNCCVDFIVGNWPFSVENDYDGIITHFFLDQFSDNELKEMVRSISDHASEKAVWSFVDFVPHPPRSYQRLLLRLMYRFFRLTTDIRSRELESPVTEMKAQGFVQNQESLLDEWIHSTLFTRY